MTSGVLSTRSRTRSGYDPPPGPEPAVPRAGRHPAAGKDEDMGSSVTVMPFGETLRVEPGESVLQAILRQGRFVKYGCKHGGCSTCRAEVIEGDYTLSANTSFSLSDADREAGVVLLCSTFVADNELTIDVSNTMDDLGLEDYQAGQHVQEFVAVVDRIEALTHDIRWLGLDLGDPGGCPFTAGQYVEVAVPG